MLEGTDWEIKLRGMQVNSYRVVSLGRMILRAFQVSHVGFGVTSVSSSFFTFFKLEDEKEQKQILHER
jgi:hypothetical protein